jgi:hypothetical protein
LVALFVICSFNLINSFAHSNSQLFDFILEIKSQNDQLLNEVKTLQMKSRYDDTDAFRAISSF